MAREDALERCPGNGAPKVLVVMQADGSQDSEEKDRGGGAASEPAWAHHRPSRVREMPGFVNRLHWPFSPSSRPRHSVTAREATMETPRFFRIPCRVCYTTTVILADRRTPAKCVKCRAPYDPASATFALVDSKTTPKPGRLTDRPPSIV